jgi:hypothetical protein
MRITKKIAKEFVELDDRINSRVLDDPNTDKKVFLEFAKQSREPNDHDGERLRELWVLISKAHILDDDAASILGQYKGDQLYIGWKSGQGCKISANAFGEIAKGKYYLNLHLKSMTLSAAGAKALANHKAGLTFKHLKTLSLKAAQSLSIYNGPCISFQRLDNISPKAARELKSFQGQISGVY